jgi:hypothetical protein
MLISLKSLIGSTSQDDYRILVTIYSLLLPICFPSNSSLQAPVIPVIPWTVTGVTRPCFARTQWGCCAARKAPCATPLNNCYPASHTGDMDDSCGWNVDGSIPINTIFSGMNIHKSQLFWCELQGCKVLTHCHIDFHQFISIYINLRQFTTIYVVGFYYSALFLWSFYTKGPRQLVCLLEWLEHFNRKVVFLNVVTPYLDYQPMIMQHGYEQIWVSVLGDSWLISLCWQMCMEPMDPDINYLVTVLPLNMA